MGTNNKVIFNRIVTKTTTNHLHLNTTKGTTKMGVSTKTKEEITSTEAEVGTTTGSTTTTGITTTITTGSTTTTGVIKVTTTADHNNREGPSSLQ